MMSYGRRSGRTWEARVKAAERLALVAVTAAGFGLACLSLKAAWAAWRILRQPEC